MGRKSGGDALSIAEKFYTMEYGAAPEDPKEAVQWLERHHRRFDEFIGGAWVKPASGEYVETCDPSTGEPIAEVAVGNTADVDAAVAAARRAFPAWQALSGHERARYLYALARQVQKHSRRLAVLETMDNGKPIRESRDIDIPLVARHFYHHAGWAQLLESEFPNYTACGVVGQIIPWNFPLLMFAWKVAPALAAGNTVVIKPAKYTPLTALAFAELAMEVGLPPGVLNVLTCNAKTGQALIEHPGIDKIAFTGSTEVGRIIRKATAQSHKKLSLELGGKSPFVVFDDADLDSAVEGLVDAIWFNQGQVCCAGSRLLVQERVAETLYAKVRARMETLRVGPPLDKAIDIGAIVSPVQLETIRKMVDAGRRRGRALLAAEQSAAGKGLFLPAHAAHRRASRGDRRRRKRSSARCWSRMTFRTPAEAVELANNTVYGLAASIWSENINVALDLASQVKAGVVWVNSTNQFDAACGFGGYRESGYGREGGREGMLEYLTPKWLHTLPPAQAAAHRAATAADDDGSFHSRRRFHRPHRQAVHRRQAGAARLRLLASRSTAATASCSAKRRSAIAKTSATRSKPRVPPPGWARATAHARAQVLYYIAENMIQRRDEIAHRLAAAVGEDQAARRSRSLHRAHLRLRRLGGQIRRRRASSARPQHHHRHARAHRRRWHSRSAEAPLLGLLSLVLPAIAMGNTVVAVPVGTLSAHPWATSISCSTPATCPAAWSTSSPAVPPSSARPSPTTTASTPSGASAARRKPPWSGPPPSAT